MYVCMYVCISYLEFLLLIFVFVLRTGDLEFVKREFEFC